jgi:hypothetical protein
MARFPEDPISRDLVEWKQIGDLQPGDEIGGAVELRYTVVSAPSVTNTYLNLDVTYADGDAGTKSWLADQGAETVPIWNSTAAEQAVATRLP